MDIKLVLSANSKSYMHRGSDEALSGVWGLVHGKGYFCGWILGTPL